MKNILRYYALMKAQETSSYSRNPNEEVVILNWLLLSLFYWEISIFLENFDSFTKSFDFLMVLIDHLRIFLVRNIVSKMLEVFAKQNTY